MLEILSHLHKWNDAVCCIIVPEAQLKTLNPFLCSCREGGVLTVWRWEHQHVDRHRGGDSPPGGHRHHFHPVLETVSDWQAGVPARRHDLHPAETEGRVRSLLYGTVSDFMPDFVVSVFQSLIRFTVPSLNDTFESCKTVIDSTVTTVTSVIKKKKQYFSRFQKPSSSLLWCCLNVAWRFGMK